MCPSPPVRAEGALSARIEELADKLTSSTSGEVVALEGQTVYINLGEKECIYEGCELDVIRFGEPIATGNRLLHKERPVAEIRVTRVRKGMSMASIVTSFGQIEKGDKVFQKRKKVTRIGLTEFPYRDGSNDFTRNVYESFSVLFTQKGMQVVERAQLEKVLHDRKITYSGMINVGTAQKLGQLLGTQAVLVGAATDMGNDVAVRARLVDVEKGVVISAAQVEITKTPEVLAMLDSKGSRRGPKVPRRKSLIPVAGGVSIPVSGRTPEIRKDVPFENDFVRIEVVSFKHEPAGFDLKLNYFNKSRNALNLVLTKPESNAFLIDEDGKRHRFKDGELIHFREFPARSVRTSQIVFHEQKSAGKSYTFTAEYYDGRGHSFSVAIKELMVQ
jgi:TolB-like protein